MAVEANGTDLTEFAVASLLEASRRVLADRTDFTLNDSAAEAWEAVNSRPARDLPGLRGLMLRPSPFTAS